MKSRVYLFTTTPEPLYRKASLAIWVTTFPDVFSKPTRFAHHHLIKVCTYLSCTYFWTTAHVCVGGCIRANDERPTFKCTQLLLGKGRRISGAPLSAQRARTSFTKRGTTFARVALPFVTARAHTQCVQHSRYVCSALRLCFWHSIWYVY